MFGVCRSDRPSYAGLIAGAFTDFLFPPKCRACGVLFRPPGQTAGEYFRTVLGTFLCPSCVEGFLPAASPRCPVCGEVFHSRGGEDHLCGPCIQSPKKFHKARAVGVYREGLLKAVHCLKYRGRIEMARPLGKLLFEAYRQHWHPDDIDLVLPVPLHPRRMRERGFNQSLLLLRRWPVYLASEDAASALPEIAPDLLKRPHPTRPQTGLGRAERLRNLRGAFAVAHPDKVKDRRILLVDDVYTTGATVSACTGVLLKAGAARVDILTLARTRNK